MDRANVIITSDDPEFSRTLTTRWQSESPPLPNFTLMGADLCESIACESFSLGICGYSSATNAAPVLHAFSACTKPAIFVSASSTACREASDSFDNVMVVRQRDGWADTVVLLAQESLKGCLAVDRAERAEAACAVLEAQAAVGCYMLDMRHTLSNALTSLLGNSELLLMESTGLSTERLAQLDTIRTMALRMNEVLARFSSLEKELKLAERLSKSEVGQPAKAAVAGL